MLDYDREAQRYDQTRGGQPRADAAAAALVGLLGPDVHHVLDVGAGTCIVSAEVATYGKHVVAVDGSTGMLGVAAPRLPGRRVCADARRLPVSDGTFDGVYAMWLLHLVRGSEQAVAECVRALRPGGVFVTTVDLEAAHLEVPCDVNQVLGEYAGSDRQRHATDGHDRIRAAAEAAGARFAGATTYVGHGRGRVPSRLVGEMRGGYSPVAGMSDADRARCGARIAELPDQDVRRPDPTYTLHAFTAS